MKTTTLIFLSLIFFSQFSFAISFEKGKIEFVNGKSKEGFVKLLDDCTDTKVYYSSSLNSDQEIFKSDSVKRVVYFIGDHQYNFEYLKAYISKKKDFWQTLDKKTYWYYKEINGLVSLYTSSFTKLNVKDGQLKMTYYIGKDYVVKKEEEVGVKKIGIHDFQFSIDAMDYYFHYMGPRYFADYPELAARIKKEEFGTKDIEKVVQIYNEWHMSKLEKK